MPRADISCARVTCTNQRRALWSRDLVRCCDWSPWTRRRGPAHRTWASSRRSCCWPPGGRSVRGPTPSTLVCSFVAIIIRNHLSFLLILPGANPVIRADSALFRMLRLTETIDKYDLDCWCIYKETFNLFTVKKPWFVEFPWGLLCGHFAIVHTHTSKCFWQLSFTYVITTSLRGWWWHFKKCLIRNVHDAHDTLYYCKENKEKSLSLTEGILGKNLQNIRGFIHTFRKW